MLVSTVKIALLAHTLLVTDLGLPIKGSFDSNSRAYQSAMRNLASLATSEEASLKLLQERAAQMGYFNFRNNRNSFAEAVWKAKESLISDSKQPTDESSGETVDVTPDTSTTSSVVKKKKPVVKKTKKAE